MKPSTRLILLYDVRSQHFAILLFMCLVYGGLASVFCLLFDFPIVAIIFGAATLIGIMVLAVRIVQRQFAFRGMFENWESVEVCLTSVMEGEGNELTIAGKYASGDRSVYFDTQAPLWMRTITLEPGDKLTALVDPQHPAQVILRDLYTANWGKEAHISWSRINPIDYLPLRQSPYNLVFYLGLAGLLLGLGLIITMGNIGLQIDASQKWPSTNGRIVGTSIYREVVHDTDSSGRDADYIQYCPMVTYRYEVGGVSLSDNTLQLGSVCDRNRSITEATIAQYKLDAPVVVYYNPKKPSEAILHKIQWKGTDNFMIVMALVAIILPSLGAVLFAMLFGLLNRLRQSIE